MSMIEFDLTVSLGEKRITESHGQEIADCVSEFLGRCETEGDAQKMLIVFARIVLVYEKALKEGKLSQAWENAK